MVFGPLYSEVFQDDGDGYAPAAGVDAYTFISGSPRIGNPGTLPMRSDEPGIPLVASCPVLDGHGQPLIGAKLEIFHAADNGNYAGLYDDGVPKYDLPIRRSKESPRPARLSDAASIGRPTSTMRSTTPI